MWLESNQFKDVWGEILRYQVHRLPMTSVRQWSDCPDRNVRFYNRTSSEYAKLVNFILNTPAESIFSISLWDWTPTLATWENWSVFKGWVILVRTDRRRVTRQKPNILSQCNPATENTWNHFYIIALTVIIGLSSDVTRAFYQLRSSSKTSASLVCSI